MRCHALSIPLLCALLSACGPVAQTTSSQTTAKPTDPKLYPPCHPGCFPTGTQVATPTGLRAIESIGRGEVVTLVEPEGTLTTGTVEAVFETCNELLDVATDAGTLRTTETQPLCLAVGGFIEAGRLKSGDSIWRWVDGKRVATTVTDVRPVEGTSTVFNLVVGTDKMFVANGFIARGKPPADR